MYIGAIDLGFVLTQQGKDGEYRIFKHTSLIFMQRPEGKYEFTCDNLRDLADQLRKEAELTPEQIVDGWQISDAKPEPLPAIITRAHVMTFFDDDYEDDWDGYGDDGYRA